MRSNWCSCIYLYECFLVLASWLFKNCKSDHIIHCLKFSDKFLSHLNKMQSLFHSPLVPTKSSVCLSQQIHCVPSECYLAHLSWIEQICFSLMTSAVTLMTNPCHHSSLSSKVFTQAFQNSIASKYPVILFYLLNNTFNWLRLSQLFFLLWQETQNIKFVTLII